MKCSGIASFWDIERDPFANAHLLSFVFPAVEVELALRDAAADFLAAEQMFAGPAQTLRRGASVAVLRIIGARSADAERQHDSGTHQHNRMFLHGIRP